MNTLKKSPVWKYFSISGDDILKAVCSVCKQKISRGGKTLKACSTSALIDHLRARHVKEFAEFEAKKREEGAKKKLEEEAKCSTPIITCFQPTIDQAFKHSEAYNINSNKAQGLHRCLVEMIARDLQPLSIAEDEGFRRFVHQLDPRYTVPSRRYITETILPKVHNDVHKKIENLVNQARDIVFTTDLWTCQTNILSFLSMTAQWLNDDFDRVSVLLGVRNLPNSHTAVNICALFEKMMEEWNIPKDRCHAVLRDNAANMVRAFKDMNMTGLPCFAHSLQLCVEKAIMTQRSVIDILAIGRKIVSHFHHSSSATAKLREIQEKLKIPGHALIQDVSTRWNSSFYMLERLVEQKSSLALYSAENNDITNFTNFQWQLIPKIIAILKPAEQITKKMCSKSSSISFVIPTVHTLIRFYSSTSDDSGVQTMKAEMKQLVQERFEQMEELEHYFVATILDPRFKDAFFQNARSKEKAINHIETLLQTVCVGEETHPQDNLESNPKDNKETQSDLWDCFNDILDQTLESQHQQQVSELTIYLKEPLQDRNSDSLVWWRTNKLRFPKLTKISRKFLAPPPTSVDSERLFSVAGGVYDDKRSRLGADNAEKLLFLHDNLIWLNFCY